MGDFRQISNVKRIYKLLTKILVDRLANVIGELIFPNQSTFTKGSLILDNTMLADEMVYGFFRILHQH